MADPLDAPAGSAQDAEAGTAKDGAVPALPVVAVVGPTGSGKSDLAVALALELGCEVINADSMQFYRGMDIGTAKITEAAAFHLVADPASADDYSLRRSRAGDAWDRSQADSCGAPVPGSAAGTTGVSLGMPTLPVRGR